MNNKINEVTIREIIKILESQYRWMKIEKHNGKYLVRDTRFQPYSIITHGLTEDELLKELKPYL